MSQYNPRRTSSTETEDSEADAGHEIISPAEIKICAVKYLYQGPYSSVIRGRWRGDEVAIKILAAAVEELSAMRRKVGRELGVWSHLRHLNIVPLHGYIDPGEGFGDFGAFISPWYRHGDAEKFFRQHGSRLSIEQRYNFWRGVIYGVEYLHTCTPVIVHGDLKPSNILIDDEGNPRICDFGLCSVFLKEGHSGFTTTTEHTGTPRYLAPELVTNLNAWPTTESDIYALGCIGLELLFSQTPYKHHRTNLKGQIFNDIRSGIPPGRRPRHLPSEIAYLWNILESCWNRDPTRRPSASELALLREMMIEEDAVHVNTEEHPVHAQEQGRSSENAMGVVGRVLRNFQDKEVHGAIRLYQGECIKQIERVDDEWWYGVSASDPSRRGLFLDNYVMLRGTNKVPGQVTPKVVKALRSYCTSKIMFSEGDRITNVSVTTLAKWKGTVNGRTGIFPASHVKLVA